MKKQLITHRLLAFSILTLLSCGNSGHEKTGKGNINIEDAITNAEKRGDVSADAAGGNTCLLAYQEKYDQLLSQADILALTGFSADRMKTKYQKVMKPEYHSFQYTFKNGRIEKIPGLSREMQISDVVSVGSIKSMSLKQFKGSYRAVSDEEMQAAKKVLDSIAEHKTTDPEAKAAMEKAEKSNVSSETVKNAGGALLGTFKEVAKAYTQVDGLGDAAVWNTLTNDLYVLQDGVKFEVKAGISNDKEKNKAIAMKLAKKIIEKCK